MKKDYICPYCKGKLKVKDFIVFSGKVKTGETGLIFLSPKLGDYHVFTHPSFNHKKGEHVEYFCPICHANLAALEYNENLVKVLMVDEQSAVYEILFSGIAGEHCTYVLKETELEAFGENSKKYKDFIGESPRY